MICITVARKPSLGTVAVNVVAYGCGALNVDGSRIATADVIENHARSAEAAVSKGKYGDSREQENHQTVGQQKGRWPANLLLQHLEGCQRVGTRQVKTSAPASGPTLTGKSTSFSRGVFNGVGSTPNYAGTDGMETMEAWECQVGCPIATLDAQSGVLKSGTGAVKRSSSATHLGNLGAAYGQESRPEGTPMVTYGDQGGASRFFKTVGGKV